MRRSLKNANIITKVLSQVSHQLQRQATKKTTKMLPLLQVIFLLASSLVAWTSAFVPVTRLAPASLHHASVLSRLQYGSKSILLATTSVPPVDNGDNVKENNDNIELILQLDRREWFQQVGRIVLGCSTIICANSLFHDSMAHAATTSGDQDALGGRSVLLGSTPEHPIVVLGAGGKTGKLCTQVLAKKRLYCRAVTRSGRQTLEGSSSFVSYVIGDVSDYESTRAAIKGADGVIFAASASGKPKGRGDPAHVDYLGAYHTAKACLEENVPKLVLISAGAVTRPDSAGFVALNVLTKFLIGENIMGYKAAGEQALRNAYATASTNGGYTIIRPGGLSDSEALGASKIHISQGDGRRRHKMQLKS
jgi:NAD(P)H-binding